MRAAFPAQRPSLPRVWPYSLTVTPQPEALLTMASTLPDSSSGHQASMLVRIAALPPSWSSRWKASAPQQPALAAIRVCMPAASSTRAVARLMLACGPGAGVLRCRHLGLERCRQQAAQQLPGLHRGREQRRGQALFQRPAQGLLAQRAGHLLVDDLAAYVQQMAVLHAAGAGAFAVAASQATVQVQLGFAARGLAFQHLLDQVDAPARAVELIAEQLVGGAGGAAKAAVHALAQYGFGFQAVGTVAVFGGESGLHGVDQRCATTRRCGRAYQS